MKSSNDQLESRGYVTKANIERYKHLDKDDLIIMLESEKATLRTIGARCLAHFKEVEVIYALIEQLRCEKKLYTKIALTETLASYGTLSCKILIDYLGKIGNNQYKTLPNKKFNKSNYPLPRDIIARSIIKMGKVAIPYLVQCLKSDDESKILEALDACGYISYYENDTSAESTIIEMFNKYKGNDLVIWKLLRVLQAFDSDEAISILEIYADSDVYQHRVEATRSIEKIKSRAN